MTQHVEGITPLRVMGSKISYYTGKFEGYLRYKEIPYEFVAMTPGVRREVTRRTGAAQMPAVRLADGRWMTDTTPMIAWLEQRFPDPPVIPLDPVQRCFGAAEVLAEVKHGYPGAVVHINKKQARRSRGLVSAMLPGA